MMKKYKVYASQLVYYVRTVEAESVEDAEEFAYNNSNGLDWSDYDYGEWAIEKTEEVKP